ncbi:MAG: type III pantothenate kinase [Sulfurisoma sp.]|nr:type III pantothenate kinase [Sulfurisoma sp.]
MILCIDSGNTRLKWGLRDGDVWLVLGAVAHAQAGALQLPHAPVRIVACNVAGAGGRAAVEGLARRLGLAVEWVRSQAARCDVVNRYEAPEQLGADRWAALIGARGLHAGPCVVVMCGTATTIDVLDADGVFQGGLILPGIDMMRAALADGTADLPVARGEVRDLPRNTFDAIASGAVDATTGAIERMARRVAGAVPRDTAPHNFLCLLSGGAAGVIAPRLTLPHRVIDNLVLEGVARIAAAL